MCVADPAAALGSALTRPLPSLLPRPLLDRLLELANGLVLLCDDLDSCRHSSHRDVQAKQGHGRMHWTTQVWQMQRMPEWRLSLIVHSAAF